MSESHADLASVLPSLAHFGRRCVDSPTTTARESYHNSGSGSLDQVINNTMIGLQEQIDVHGDGNIEINASATPTAITTGTEPVPLGVKRPALTHISAPDPIRQHLEATQDTSFENLNSAGAHRARLVALLTYIHQHSGDMESRLNARITQLENTRHIVQNNEIAVIKVNPTVVDLKEKNTLLAKCNQHPNKNNSNVADDAADARESASEMQFSQLQIRYATMETNFETQLEFALAQKEESQRSVSILKSVAGAALEEAKQCREELAAAKVQMRSAHVALLTEVASLVYYLKEEVGILKDERVAVAAQALVAARPAPPQVSSTSTGSRGSKKL